MSMVNIPLPTRNSYRKTYEEREEQPKEAPTPYNLPGSQERPAAQGGMAGLQLPTQGEEDYNSVLRGMAGQINQPYRPGWAALPGVASSIMGGMAAQKLKENERVNPERQLQFELNKARLAKMQQDAQGYGVAAATYGKSGAVFSDRNGNQYTIQFADDGTRKILPLDGLTQARGVKTIDTGTGTQIIDGSTGQAVREVDKNTAEAERQKVLGRERGQTQSGLPKRLAGLDTLKTQTDVVTQEVDRALSLINNFTAGAAGRVGQYVPGTDAYSLGQMLVTIKGNIGFDKLQEMRENSPTGGALGQVSNFELDNLQAVIGSLDQSQDPKVLAENLNRIKTVLARRLERSKRLILFERQLVEKGYEPGTPQYEQAFSEFSEGLAQQYIKQYNVPPRAPTGAGDEGTVTEPSTIPQGAANLLRQDPSLAQQFDAKYGQGAAARILGQ